MAECPHPVALDSLVPRANGTWWEAGRPRGQKVTWGECDTVVTGQPGGGGVGGCICAAGLPPFEKAFSLRISNPGRGLGGVSPYGGPLCFCSRSFLFPWEFRVQSASSSPFSSVTFL